MYTIDWSAQADDSYERLLNYLYERYGVDSVIKMDEKTMDLIDKLRTNQYLCPPSFEHRGLRKCVVTKYTSLIYRVGDNTIELVTFTDNRSKETF